VHFFFLFQLRKPRLPIVVQLLAVLPVSLYFLWLFLSVYFWFEKKRFFPLFSRPTTGFFFSRSPTLAGQLNGFPPFGFAHPFFFRLIALFQSGGTQLYPLLNKIPPPRKSFPPQSFEDVTT